MAVSFTRFSWRLWSGKEKEPVSNGSSLNSSFEWGFGLREPETVKFPSVKGTKITAPHRKVKRKWQSREQRRIDREFDAEVVPSDGVCLSGSESDDPDWSIGWFEPHGPGFESDDGLAVLVPSYKPGCKKVMEGSNNHLFSAIKNLSHEFSPGKSHCFYLFLHSFCMLVRSINLNSNKSLKFPPSPIFSSTFPLI
ncbi:hypothetical protein I3842_07G047800 [Carya illinoinensis]|uniref:Uncharacterized protein n=1 Tax=Carya illinoinensis TaxID=32201 RepID=A0A922EIH2_CARIL|nr:hypothetical protein I3842_07G047800 [Carya illinoinensis]